MTAVLAALAVAITVLLLPPPAVVARRRLARVASARPRQPKRGGVLSRRRGRSRRVVAQTRAATVEAVAALASELRAGSPPPVALARIAPSAGPLDAPLLAAAEVAAAGGDPLEPLLRLAEQPGAAGWRGVAAAWRVTAQVGGPVADVLERLADALDEAERHRQSLEAALAAPRATVAVLSALPLLGVALGESVGAHSVTLLVHQPIGWGLDTAALVLDAVGAWWVSRLTRGVLR